MLRFFHTADWHLGQLFHQHSRHYEHQAFLTWLLAQLEQYQPDALLIAGDVFDVVNPSAQAQKQLYQFLADAHHIVPHLQILMIAGNHDSGYRLEQVRPLLAKYQTEAIGVIDWMENNQGEIQLDEEKLIRPIYARDGDKISDNVLAWCICLPFLRSAEITGRLAMGQDVMQATQQLYQRLITKIEQSKTPEQAVILMTHAHVQGGEESKLSERNIIIGHQEALSVDIFSPILDYVALGHLHKPQAIQHAHIRYSGSPIPLSFSELHYQHQVMMVDIDAQHQATYTPLYIPRALELIAIRCPLNELMTALEALDSGQIDEIEQRPLLNIEYISDVPAPPDLRHQVEQALPVERYRLVRLVRYYQQQLTAENEQNITINTPAPSPVRLFEQAWQRDGNDITQIDEQMYQDFQQLCDEAEEMLQQVKS